MKNHILTLVLSLLSSYAFAQASMLGHSRSEIIEKNRDKETNHHMKESMTANGKPYLAYDDAYGRGGFAYYFEGDICVEYRVIILATDGELLLKRLRDSGYDFHDGAWFNNEKQVVGLVSKDDKFIKASFFTFDYMMEMK